MADHVRRIERLTSRIDTMRVRISLIREEPVDVIVSELASLDRELATVVEELEGVHYDCTRNKQEG